MVGQSKIVYADSEDFIYYFFGIAPDALPLRRTDPLGLMAMVFLALSPTDCLALRRRHQ